jgi:hypothetical protein
VGQKYSSTSGVTGQWLMDMSGDNSPPDWQTMDITGGTATMKMVVVGVEQITVSGTTYLAAKLTSSLKINCVGQLNYNGIHASSASITDNETVWAVPGVGVIQMNANIHINGSISGVASGSFSTNTTLALQ